MGRARGQFSLDDERFMRRALVLAGRAWGATSPNPMVGAVLVRDNQILGEGWHHRAGQPHAEINALASARKRGFAPRGATLYVTLEPCSTFGRTPPCTDAVIRDQISRVVIGATDPNPRHTGRAFQLLRKAGIQVEHGLLKDECNRLNEAFNHWIVHRSPFVVLKSAMSLDGKIATNSGESKWITSQKARAFGMRLRAGTDAILCGINTILRDNPALTIRPAAGVKIPAGKRYYRIILDREARTPLTSNVVTDDEAAQTIVVASDRATKGRISELEKRVRVLVSPVAKNGREFKLVSLLRQLGRENITSILVEGGGETHANFLAQRMAHRIFFFYAPLVMTGRAAPKSIGGEHTLNRGKGVRIASPEWQALGPDLLLSGLLRY